MLRDDVCFIVKELVAGEGLDWQHIRNEFYTAMPESFGEVSGFVWSTATNFNYQTSARATQWKLAFAGFREQEGCWRQDETGFGSWEVGRGLDLLLLYFQVSVDDCIDAFLASREGLILKLLGICSICPISKTHNHGVALLSKSIKRSCLICPSIQV